MSLLACFAEDNDYNTVPVKLLKTCSHLLRLEFLLMFADEGLKKIVEKYSDESKEKAKYYHFLTSIKKRFF